MLAKETLEEIFQTRFYEAKDNWKAKCPFHDERTPSFYVHKDDLIANCFGCGVGGNIDTLVAHYLSCSTSAARERLGISLETRVRRAGRRNRRESKPQIFPESWLAPYEQSAHRSIIARGFLPSTIKAVEGAYDRAFKRQIFPHRGRGGELLGVAGRACGGQEPKWFFYWNYDKGAALYRPMERCSAIRSPLVVVEGVLDYLWLKQNGVSNVAATMGTKFTKAQVVQMLELSDDIIIAYDNDEAGRTASERLYKALRGYKVRFVEWPLHIHDPADIPADQVNDALNKAKNKLQLCL